jgi:hypothetical protein
MLQLVFTLIVIGTGEQVSGVQEKPAPLATRELIVIAEEEETLLEIVMVEFTGVPTLELPKLTLGGAKMIVGGTPVMLSDTVCGEPGAFDGKLNVPFCVPAALVNPVTLTVQLAPGASPVAFEVAQGVVLPGTAVNVVLAGFDTE